VATIVYESHPRGGQVATITISNETSGWVFVPTDNVGLDLVVTSGSATVQQTAATPADVLAATATAFDWAAGAIATGTKSSSLVVGASAVRLTGTGVAKLSVRF
jgi:hypothetical protein